MLLDCNRGFQVTLGACQNVRLCFVNAVGLEEAPLEFFIRLRDVHDVFWAVFDVLYTWHHAWLAILLHGCTSGGSKDWSGESFKRIHFYATQVCQIRFDFFFGFLLFLLMSIPVCLLRNHLWCLVVFLPNIFACNEKSSFFISSGLFFPSMPLLRLTFFVEIFRLRVLRCFSENLGVHLDFERFSFKDIAPQFLNAFLIVTDLHKSLTLTVVDHVLECFVSIGTCRRSVYYSQLVETASTSLTRGATLQISRRVQVFIDELASFLNKQHFQSLRSWILSVILPKSEGVPRDYQVL